MNWSALPSGAACRSSSWAMSPRKARSRAARGRTYVSIRCCYFEGERGHQFRILRAVKNRFGRQMKSVVFEMTGSGWPKSPTPRPCFCPNAATPAPGSVVFAGMEGTRPVLTEIQALVAPSPLGTPRRTVVGLDSARLSTVLAVLEARCGIPFAGMDVFLNVAGGMRVMEPAADLALACALLSAREDHALPPETVVFRRNQPIGRLAARGAGGKQVERSPKTWF